MLIPLYVSRQGGSLVTSGMKNRATLDFLHRIPGGLIPLLAFFFFLQGP